MKFRKIWKAFFALVCSAEFGLGKSLMATAIEEEALEAIDRLKQLDGKDILIDQNFNIPIFNVLWRIVTNNRYSVSSDVWLHVLNSTESFWMILYSAWWSFHWQPSEGVVTDFPEYPQDILLSPDQNPDSRTCWIQPGIEISPGC